MRRRRQRVTEPHRPELLFTLGSALLAAATVSAAIVLRRPVYAPEAPTFGGNIMRAVVFSGAGGPEVMQLAERPDPQPAANEVVVAATHAGLNPADLAQRAGRYPAPPGSPPDTPGLEVSGTVVACVAAHGVRDSAEVRFAAQSPPFRRGLELCVDAVRTRDPSLAACDVDAGAGTLDVALACERALAGGGPVPVAR